ncbi:GSCOCG00012224001-RA-CDS, partial [Cotesia congregata]
YKDEIVFFNESGHDCIVCFKGFIYKIISKKPPSHKKNDVREERLQIVRDAAAIILEDIRSQCYETKEYPPSDSFLKDVNTLVPETLSVLLKGIICQSKRKSLNAAERKCTSIAHSIIAATRPASFISPLLLGVGSFLYKKYGSSNLIDVLSSLGFSASYNAISLFEESCAFRPARNILPHAFFQFVFDNADFNSNTIDGKNTFHAMGGIQCVTPYNSIENDTSLPRVSKKIPAS